MTRSTTNTALSEGDEPSAFVEPAKHYRSWGWTVLQSGDRLLLTTGTRVSAVELPAELGTAIQHYLGVHMLAGPAIALPGRPNLWLLLAASAEDASPVNLMRLRARGAITHRDKSLVPLPPSRTAAGAVTWIVPPSIDGPALPPHSAVAAAIRAVTETNSLGVPNHG